MYRRMIMILGFALALALQGSAGESVLRVEVRTTQVRSAPSFLGRVLATVNYGDAVTPVRQQGAWIEVSTPAGQRGWLHESALGKRKVVMRAGDADVETVASGDELVLAGKGFSSRVENAYREAHREISFTWVDRMEAVVIRVEESVAFLREGGVQPGRGGVR